MTRSVVTSRLNIFEAKRSGSDARKPPGRIRVSRDAVLNILAFQERHQNKDAYDLIYTLANYPEGGPRSAGLAATASPIREQPQVTEALRLVEERFKGADHDGPSAYSNFLARPTDNNEHKARLRNEAVVAVDQFLTAAGAK